jgi:hypothetical protein
MTDSPFNLSTLVLDKNSAKVTIFANGRNPKPMKEYAPFPKVVGFIQNEMGISLQGNPRYEWMTTVKTELEMMQKYHSLWNRKQLCFTTAHSLTKLKWGRTIPANNSSLNIMHRPTRHALCKDEYEDWDMKNAHVSILCETFKNREDVDISALWEYANNPTKWREEVCIHHGLDPVKDKDSAKQLFIRILFGGSYLQWIRDFDIEKNISASQRHPLVISIENQLVAVRDLFYEANPQIVKDLKKHDIAKFADTAQLKRTLLAIALQTIERWIMEKSILYLVENRKMDLQDIVPCQDGFMIRKNLSYVGLKQEIEAETFDKFGMRIEWVRKEFDEAIEIPDGTEDNMNGVFNDAEAARKIFELYPHWVCCREILFVFDDDTGMWETDKTTAYKIIERFTDHLFVLVEGRDNEIIKTKKSYGNTLALMEKMPTLIKTLCKNNDWIKQSQNSSLGKILFKNGYYDFRKELFYSKEEYGFNPNIVFFGRIHIDFDQFDNAYIEDIRMRLFVNPLGEEMGDYLIQNLARALAGDLLKKFLFGLGGTDGGKSMLTKAISNSIGDYFGTFNADNFATRNFSSGDEAQTLRWCMLLRYKRIVISNELKTNITINGNALKKVSSGGDAIVGRVHGGVEEEFVPHFLAMVLANDLPKIVPYDSAVDNRATVFSFSKTYVDEPSNEFELKKDYNLEQEIETVEFKRAMIGLLIKSYMDKSKFGVVPNAAIIAKEEWITSDKSVIDTFMNDFEITGDEGDWIRSKEIEDWITENKLGITMMKFSSEMKKYTAINKVDGVVNKYKKIGGKTVMCWFGIQRCTEAEIIEE